MRKHANVRENMETYILFRTPSMAASVGKLWEFHPVLGQETISRKIEYVPFSAVVFF
jgi:hypothetical protein